MCGRYTIIAKAQEVEKRFQVEVPEAYTPRFNAAPTQILPVITNEQSEGLSFFHWGLIPSWSKDISIGAKLINARSETITEKASFKQAVDKRRCLVLTDGYYEWKKISSKSKVPYRIQLSSEQLFAFAGIWEKYQNEDNIPVYTFTIITTESNSKTSHIHQRMPVVLDPEREKIWLSKQTSKTDYLELLRPYPAEKIKYYSVSNLVNSVRNDDARLIAPAPAMDQSGNLSLFD